MTVLDQIPVHVLELATERARRARTADTSWSKLTPEQVDEGLALLARGITPGYGWWAARLPKPETYAEIQARHPEAPPRVLKKVQNLRLAQWELVAAAVDFADTPHFRTEDAKTCLAQLAADHGLGVDDLTDAYMALEDGR